MSSGIEAQSLDSEALTTITRHGSASSDALDSAEPADDVVGTTLNSTYRVEAVLGEGGMGRVYRARHTRISSKRYAVKVLHREYGADSQVLARFQREAEAAASVSHPNVVGVYDVDRTEQGIPYLVCEYLAGKDLAEHLRVRGKLDVAAALHIALQVSAGVEAAHAQGVIHRDLKPQNVFLLADDTGELPERPAVKLLDFGLSRFLDGTSAELTRAGVIMGTPAFMAPEQARGERADHRLDVYGLGTILYTVLSGRPPFNEESPQATILAVLRESPPALSELEPTVPPQLAAIVARAMAKQPADRFATMEELRRALEAAVAMSVAAPLAQGESSALAGAVSSSDPNPMWAVERRTSSRRWARISLGAATLAVTFVTVPLLLLAGMGIRITFPGAWAAQWSILPWLGAGLALVAVPGAVAWWCRARSPDVAALTQLFANLARTLIAGLLTFGAAALLLRFGGVLPEFGLGSSVFAPARVAAWRGWDFVLGAATLAVAVAVFMSTSLTHPDKPLRRMLAVGLRCGGVVVAVAVVLWGFHRAGEAHAGFASGASAGTEGMSNSAPAAEELVLAPVEIGAELEDEEPSSPTVAMADKTRRATPQELETAKLGGEDALKRLASRYPEDAAVLRALAFDYASRAAGLVACLSVMKQLFAVEPAAVSDPELRFFVARAAETPGAAAEAAFELLEKHMGTAGPDLLYELLLRSKASEEAQAILVKPSVRKKFTPELAVAYDLRNAEGCAARLPLLARAAAEGDERSIMVLAALSSGTRRGCGKWKRSPCKPACPVEAPKFREAIAAISARVNPGGSSARN